MFGLGRSKREISGDASLPELVRQNAEARYRSGAMHCAEAVVAAVREALAPEAPEAVVTLAAGFGGGSGAGCICGAVVGGTMAFSLVEPDRKKVMKLTKTLHEWFRAEYGSACCRVIRGDHKGICAEITGKVAAETARLLEER